MEFHPLSLILLETLHPNACCGEDAHLLGGSAVRAEEASPLAVEEGRVSGLGRTTNIL